MNETYLDYFDFYTRGPYAPFATETRSAGTEPVRMIHAAQTEGDFSDPAHNDVMLVQILGAEAPITRDYGAGRVRSLQRFGDFEVQAPNVPSTILSEGDHELRVFVLPFSRIHDVLESSGHRADGDFGQLHAAPFRDFFLEQLCQRLWLESEAGNPHGDLFADGALIGIAATLLRLQGAAFAAAPAPATNPLVDRLRTQIDHYIDAHLDQSFGMRDLAALVDQPEAAFAQAFKAVYGQTPHQYVLARRIARAQELLATGELPLAEVAYTCGFASQSHMTDVFRQKLGVAPGRYRKEVRG